MTLVRSILFALVLSVTLIPSYHALAYSPASCQCVAFRLDDVQDYWLDSVQTKIIDTFHQKNASLTIGIIGNAIGKDPSLVNDIKSKLGRTPKLEIANHGWNHEDFTQFSREQQNMFMSSTNDKISNIFGIVPSMFIPPFDTANSDTMIAFLENNFRYISSDVSQDPPAPVANNTRVFHIPGTAQTSDLSSNGNIWTHQDDQHLLVTIMSDIQKYGYSVLILHPPEYAIKIHSHYANEVDKAQIQNLGLLIDSIKRSGIKIVPMDQIPSSMHHKPYPNWLHRVFSSNANGTISDKQVLTDINYLIDKKIINLNSRVQ